MADSAFGIAPGALRTEARKLADCRICWHKAVTCRDTTDIAPYRPGGES